MDGNTTQKHPNKKQTQGVILYSRTPVTKTLTTDLFTCLTPSFLELLQLDYNGVYYTGVVDLDTVYQSCISYIRLVD